MLSLLNISVGNVLYLVFWGLHINSAKWYLYYKPLFSCNILLRVIHVDTGELILTVVYYIWIHHNLSISFLELNWISIFFIFQRNVAINSYTLPLYKNCARAFLTQWFSNFSMHQVHLECLLQQTARPFLQNFWFWISGVGLENLSFNQFPSDTEVAGQEPHWEPLRNVISGL